MDDPAQGPEGRGFGDGAAGGTCVPGAAGAGAGDFGWRLGRLEAGLRDGDHRGRDPRRLLQQPRRRAAAIPRADRNRPAPGDDASGADPAEGHPRSFEQDRDLGDVGDGSDVLSALCRERLGRSAGRLHGQCRHHRCGLVRLRRHPGELAGIDLDRRRALRHPLRGRGHDPDLPERRLPEAGAEAGGDAGRLCRERQEGERSVQPALGRGAARLQGRRTEHVHLSVDLLAYGGSGSTATRWW